MRRTFLRLGGAAALAGVAQMGLPAFAQAVGKTYTFGIVPQQTASELARIWIPVFNVINERAGVPLRFATAPDIPAFEKRLVSGTYDLAYMNPYHYTVFSQKPGYAAFAKEKARRLRGIVVVRKDSPITDLAGLSGKEVSFPAPASFAATVLVRAELESKKISIQPKFVGSHESVYLNVAKGIHAGGGGIVRTFQTMDAPVRDELRILWQTKDYTPHAFAAHPRVPGDILGKVREAMLLADSDARGKAALKDIGFNGIESAQDADWADVRSLGIKTLAALLAA